MMLAGAAPSQQPPAPAPNNTPPAPAAAPAQPEDERGALKARLERSLADLKQLQAKLEDGLARLNRGESPKTVRDSVEIPRFRGTNQDGGRGPRRQPTAGTGPTGAPRPDGPGRDHHGDDIKLEPGEKETVLEFIAKHNPEFAERLKAMAKDNAAGHDRLLGRIAPRIREILAEPDAQMRELKTAELKNGWDTMSASRKLAEALRKGETSPEFQQAMANLRTMLGTSFDTEVKIRNREIATLEDRIAQIRKELAERLSERETFVNQKSEQMLKFARERANQPPRQHDKPASPGATPATPDADNKK